MSELGNSYSTILKATSLIGGAQGVSLVLGMLRVKLVAILIGPVGVGLAANYQAIQGMVGTLAGLGIQQSAVRDVSAAFAKGDTAAMSKTVLVLRRVCWLTGLAGAIAIAALAFPLSEYTFGSHEHALEIMSLGLVILFANIQGGQMALIQSARRIADLAKLNVIGAVAGTVISVSLYAWLGLRGIIPAMLLLSATQLMVSFWYARKISVDKVALAWRESFRAAGGMVRLGLVFMWNGLLVSMVAYLTRAWITNQISLQAVGIFSAAFALSGMFINFILSAMGADYYPRLTAVAEDHAAMRRLVNEQTEIGLLLAVPGLVATLTLAPWIIRIFYTAEFAPAAELLQWFILGCVGRIIGWPMGFIMLAQGKSGWFFVTQTIFNALHLVFILVGIAFLGLKGVAVAFFALYVGHVIAVWMVGRHLIQFAWTAGTKRLMFWLLLVSGLAFGLSSILPLVYSTSLGILLLALVSVWCLRGLIERLGAEHPIALMTAKTPLLRWACSL